MKDSNYLKEMNARSVWHPMAHPADSLANPPTIVTGAQGVRITDIDGHEVVDGVGGLWNVNLGYSCQPIKDAITAQMEQLPYYSIFRGLSNDAVIQLAEELRTFFEPDGLSRAFSPRADRTVLKHRCGWRASITKSGGSRRAPNS